MLNTELLVESKLLVKDNFLALTCNTPFLRNPYVDIVICSLASSFFK